MLQNYGTALSREQMKNVIGGEDDIANCNFLCMCGPNQSLYNATCHTSPCSGTDYVGGTCGGTYYSCYTVCQKV